MKRPAILAIFVLFAAAAMAQIHGVPASVTSQTSQSPMKSFAPGVPASVTSLGPYGYGTPFGAPPMSPPTTVGCWGGGMYCYPTSTPNYGGKHHHHNYDNGYGYGYGYGAGYGYVPYLYPAYSVDPTMMGTGYDYLQPSQPPVTVEESEPPAPTIFERRPAARPYARDEARYDDSYVPPAASQPKHSSEIGVGEQETTTLVFADGHKMDVHNYAIVGQNLFNFDGTGPFKVKLAELNLAATEKLNEDNGVEFKLPK